MVAITNGRCRVAAIWLGVALAALPAWAGSGSVITMPLARVKPKSGLQLTIDGRGIDAVGYRPIRVTVSPIPPGPFPADRQIRVVLSPGQYGSGTFPEVSQIIELPEGATSAEAVIAIPQTTQWYQFGVTTFESGEKLKDLSQDYLGWTSNGYGQWTEAAPAILLIDSRVPRRNLRDNQVATLMAQGADPSPTFNLPDIRTLAWVFPDPNRGITWTNTPTVVSPSGPKLSDATMLMQVQSQMSRVEMLPLTELPERWIDLSQFDVVLISANDLKGLATDAQRTQALRQWVRGGTTLLVYCAGGEFERLAEIEKHLALSPLPADPDEPESYRGWLPPDPNRYDLPLQSSWDNLRSPYMPAYGPGIYQEPEMLETIGSKPAASGRRAAPTKPPFLLRSAGLGSIVAIASDDPFPGAQEEWHWIFNSVPSNQWSWYQRNGLSLYRQNDDYWKFLIPGVGEAPVISFLLLVSLFAAIIGPVNYVLLGRARRLYLLLITVPAGAALVTTALFSYAVLTDGLGIRLRTRSFADLDQTSGQASGFARQSYYASIAPSRGLEFPEDCTVFGLAYRPANGDARNASHEMMTWDGQQRLQAGFISSRTTVQYMVLRSTKSQVKLSVRESAKAGQPPQVENRLGARIRYLLLRDSRGDYFTVSDLAADQPATLAATNPATAETEFKRLAEAVAPELPQGYDPSADRESLLQYLMPDRNYWGGIDGGSSRPLMAASLLETNIAVAFRPARHPYQPGTYIAVLDGSPVVPPGVTRPREEASLHVLRGKY